MKKILIATVIIMTCVFGANATVLFPHFVDIAPDYKEGNSTELAEAGVDCAMYHSVKPGYWPSNFNDLESFFKDTLPSDVSREEHAVGDKLLVIYTSLDKKEADTISTKPLKSTIYVLKRPDGSFAAAYCEHVVE